VGRLSAQLHGWEVGLDCESRIRFTFHALPRGRGVSEFLEVPIRARNRTIKQSWKKWITNHDAKTEEPSPEQAS
jgi:hypothetical protein